MGIQVCPRCNSTDIVPQYGIYPGMMTVTSAYSCRNCGYTSTLFPEMDHNSAKKLKIKQITHKEENRQPRRVENEFTRYRTIICRLEIIAAIAFIIILIWKKISP